MTWPRFDDLITKDNMVQIPSVASITIILAKRKNNALIVTYEANLLCYRARQLK